MKEIKLTQGKVALVDDEDYDKLNKYKWCANKHRKTFYARRGIVKYNRTNNITRMHRLIMNAPKDMQVDHIDGNGLNNQKSNLRLCTHSQNRMNIGKYKNNASGYKGVYFDKNTNKWRVEIQINNKTIYLGRFIDKEDAYKAYCDACIKHHGGFAHV